MKKLRVLLFVLFLVFLVLGFCLGWLDNGPKPLF
jgi:hypothetical protein